MTGMMSRLKLAVNETNDAHLPDPAGDVRLPGLHFGQCYSPKTGRSYIGTRPSRKRIARLCAAVSEVTHRKRNPPGPGRKW